LTQTSIKLRKVFEEKRPYMNGERGPQSSKGGGAAEFVGRDSFRKGKKLSAT